MKLQYGKNGIQEGWKRLVMLTAAVASAAVFQPMTTSALDVVMQHYDLSRTGANLQESALTPGNVNQTGFGKLFSQSVDGQQYAQPLYLSGLSIAGGTHNVVFVCTEHNSVYCFDADSSGSALWHVNFGPSVPNGDVGSCGDLTPEIGITGTPVIDRSSGTLYVDAKTKEGSSYFHRLHALDITTGAEKFGGPKVISGSVNGHSFGALHHHQRPGLVLLNGVVYLAFGSHCDNGSYWGWLIGYNATTLAQVSIFNTCASGSEGAIWQCGKAPAVDASGNIYFITGNGTFDKNTGGPSLGEAFVKMSTSSGLSVSDWFVPHDFATLNSGDRDLGSGGAVLIPGTHLLMGIGKAGKLYLVDQNNMGHFNSSSDNVVQTFSPISGTDRIGQSPVYWQGPNRLYISAGQNKTKAYQFNGSTINTTSLGTSSETQGNPGGISLSANGSSSGILWVIDNGSGGTLRAYDAINFPTEIWNSQQNSSRDGLGTYNKFVSPVVVNGKVYAATSSKLVVYGILGPPPPDFTISATPSSQTVTAGNSTSYTVNIGNVNGFSGTVTLSASGLPSGASASFNPPTVTTVGSSTMTVTTTTGTPGGTSTVTVQGTSGSLSHTTTVGLTVNPAGGTLAFEAESLSFVTNGAVAALQTDANTSGGHWLALNATAAGPYYEFTLPNIPAGTYQIKLSYKSHPGRGILQASVDGANLGSTLDQYAATIAYPTFTIGTKTFSAGNHTLRLTCTGKNSASSAFTLSADQIILVPTSSSLSFEAENLTVITNGATAALQTDANASGGHWLALNSTGTGQYYEFTLPNIPAGTYQISFSWKGNNNRGTLQASVDGTNLGSTVDQYAATQTYPTSTLGTKTLTAGNHQIRLTVTGKNSASTGFVLSADAFSLVGQ